MKFYVGTMRFGFWLTFGNHVYDWDAKVTIRCSLKLGRREWHVGRWGTGVELETGGKQRWRRA